MCQSACSLHSFLHWNLSFFLLVVQATWAALDVPWSNKKYGPDGPWQAVKIRVGGYDSDLKIDSQNHADLDVYPGGTWDSFTFSSLACKTFTTCGKGGTWNPDPNAMSWFSGLTGGWHPVLQDKTFGLTAGPLNFTQRAMTIAGKTVWNTSLSHSNAGNITHLNGKMGALQLGFLSLGAPETRQTFDTAFEEGKSGQNVTGHLFNGKLYEDKTISSYSYGLHIGSAAFEFSGSLVFGGYNKGRVIGPVTSMFKDGDRIDLLDIIIGVEYGSSPFEFTSKESLLISDTGIVSTSQQVKIDPKTPYLSLPDNTCEGLSNLLPIKFDETTKLYHWEVNDSRYKSIVTSPAYLGFVFPPGLGSTQNVTIKVPFALLNLTLDSPIVDTPVQYFPCHSFTPAADDAFRLGRAFLQAAFIGRNWISKTTWMGQAPGPGFRGAGLGDQLIDIKDTDTTIESWDSVNTNYFNQTWASHWNIIENSESRTNDTATSGTAEARQIEHYDTISVGAKAGIGIGTAAVAVAAIGFAFFFWRTRAKRKHRNSEEICLEDPYAERPYVDDGHIDYSATKENASLKPPLEIYTEARVHELSDDIIPSPVGPHDSRVYELPGHGPSPPS